MLKFTRSVQFFCRQRFEGFCFTFQFLNEDNHPAKQAKEIAVLEQTLVLQDKQLEANLDQKNDIVSGVNIIAI